jgi:hypothetical protein
MFEPETPECKLYPTDSKEEIGKEEWIAEKAMEVRADPKLMYAALEWDGEQTGSEDVYGNLAMWMAAYTNLGDEFEAEENLVKVLYELAERYAEYVLLPAHIEKMKKGAFD